MKVPPTARTLGPVVLLVSLATARPTALPQLPPEVYPAEHAQDIRLSHLKALLQARDASLGSVYVRFNVFRHDDPSNALHAREGTPDGFIQSAEGAYYWSRQRQAIHVRNLTSNKYGSSEKELWDGSRRFHLTTYPDGTLESSHNTRFRGLRILEISQFNPYGPLADGSHPGNFGFYFFAMTWSDALATSTAIEVLGERSILGRRCLGIRFNHPQSRNRPLDARTQLQDEGLVWEAWFDVEESLLALEVSFRQPQSDIIAGVRRGNIDVDMAALQKRFEGLGTRIGETDWALSRSWTITEYFQDPSGVYLPKSGVQSSPITPEIASVRLEVIQSSAIINEPIPDDLEIGSPTPGCLVLDRILGKEYEVGGNAGALDHNDRAFNSLLESAASRCGLVALPITTHQPFVLSSCGPNSVFLAARLFASATELEDVLEQFLPGERASGLSSLASVARAFESVGFACVAAECSLEDIKRIDAPVIAHLRGYGKGNHEHFAVVRSSRDLIDVYSFPEAARAMTSTEFASIWTGSILILGRSKQDIERSVAVFARSPLSGLQVAILVVGALAVPVALAYLRTVQMHAHSTGAIPPGDSADPSI